MIRGMYRLGGQLPERAAASVQLLGSGTILREVLAAAELLASDWSIASDVFSVTSFALLAREAAEVERWNRLHPDQPGRVCHLDATLKAGGVTVAASDYVRAYAQLIAPHVGGQYLALGTDGFGRSDTRVALRAFFEVDRNSIVLAAVYALAQRGEVEKELPARVIEKYGIATDAPPPWER